MRETCEVCRGEQLIRLPVHRKLSVMDADPFLPPSAPPAPYKTYPCPECAKLVDPARVSVVQCESTVSGLIPAKHMNDVMRQHGHELVALLVKDKMLNTKIVERKPDDLWPRRPGDVIIRSRVGIVSPADVEKIETRVLKLALHMLRQMATEVQAQINNWGSHYSVTVVSKDEATRLIHTAVGEIERRELEKVKN
jgi:hypothetical protein